MICFFKFNLTKIFFYFRILSKKRGMYMQQIYNKINSHKYLNKKDIIYIIDVCSDSKIKVKFLNDSNSEAYYNSINNSIAINRNFRVENLNYLINFSKDKFELESSKENSNFLVDLYNLYLLQTLFHELHHAKQIKKPLTFKTKLVKENYNFIMLNPKLYDSNHDLYYNEYDATIMALLKTLNVIEKNCKDLNQNAIIEFNRLMCAIIYHSYGNKYSSDVVSKIYDKFSSPIAYSKFLSNKFHNEYEKQILLCCIENLKKESTTEYRKLINGFSLSEKTIWLLYNIYAKNYETLNILNEVKQINKVRVKVK